MNIKSPEPRDYPRLRAIWKEAFSDGDSFLDYFWAHAFSPSRARCLYLDGEPAAALYWFDCEYGGGRVAYLYAIATAVKHRGRGLCTALLEDTHRHLSTLGYVAAMLVPASEKLFDYYHTRGYRVCTYINEYRAERVETPIELFLIDVTEYSLLRRKFLPENSVIEEGPCLSLLSEGATLYKGNGLLLACRKTGSSLYAIELLGDSSASGGILNFLDCETGIFHTPWGIKPFSMIYDLSGGAVHPPEYFGLALD